MQPAASRQQPNPNFRATGNSRSTLIAILALFLFALSGLMTGFATGAFTRPKQTAQQNNNKNTRGSAPTAVVSKQKPTASTTPVVHVTPVGCPAVEIFSNPEIADGSHMYTFSAHATDKSGGTCSATNKRITMAGITFKLWLIHRIPSGKGISFSRDSLLNTANLTNPITAKIQNDDAQEVQGLAFDTAHTPQVQQSDAQGHVTWNYTVPPSIQAGDYDAVILIDWAGQYYNWTWRNLDITKAS